MTRTAMTRGLKWQIVGSASAGDEHGPIRIYRAALDSGTWVERSRKRHTVYSVEYTLRRKDRALVFPRLGDALAEYESGRFASVKVVK